MRPHKADVVDDEAFLLERGGGHGQLHLVEVVCHIEHIVAVADRHPAFGHDLEAHKHHRVGDDERNVDDLPLVGCGHSHLGAFHEQRFVRERIAHRLLHRARGALELEMEHRGAHARVGAQFAYRQGVEISGEVIHALRVHHPIAELRVEDHRLVGLAVQARKADGTRICLQQNVRKLYRWHTPTPNISTT